MQNIAGNVFDNMTLSQLQVVAKAIGVKNESDYPDWYGIKGVKFIWHNELADPEIMYNGRKCSSYTVEDTMWEEYLEEYPAGRYAERIDFGDYMRLHADHVIELCKEALNSESEG